MTARRIAAFTIAILMALGSLPAKATITRADLDVLIQYYADYYDVPVELVHRVVQRESTYNPRARNGPYWGLMQILPETARSMGFRGQPQDLLDAETNLIYAVRYLRGAYITAGGNQDRAVRHYAAGYYYHARDKGLLEVTGLRPSPLAPPAPTPPSQAAAALVANAPTPPEPVARFEPPVVASLAPTPDNVVQIVETTPPVAVALGFAPPVRPDLTDPDAAGPTEFSALDAIALAARPQEPGSPAPASGLELSLEAASAFFAVHGAGLARIEGDIFETTFSMLEDLDAAIAQSMLGVGDEGFFPPSRPQNDSGL